MVNRLLIFTIDDTEGEHFTEQDLQDMRYLLQDHLNANFAAKIIAVVQQNAPDTSGE